MDKLSIKKRFESIKREALHGDYKGTNKNVFLKGLEFYLKIFHEIDILNIENEANKIIKNVKSKRIRGIGKWLSLIPIKFFVIFNVIGYREDIEVPIGSRVEKSINKIFGLNLKESKKSHYEIIQNLHKYLAKEANTDVFTINNGFWVLGES